MQKLSRTFLTLTAFASAIVLAATAATTAGANAAASPPSSQRVLASGLGPVFQIALNRGTVYYADGGTVSKITPQGPAVVATVPDAAGVEFSRNKRVMAIAHGSPGASRQQVTLLRKGRSPVVADILAYETRVNPDRNIVYGITSGPSAQCKAEAEAPRPGGPPGAEPPPVTYNGLVDSHPYQLAALRGGAFALAESGSNAILRVGPRGRVSTIAVLPPQPVRLTATQAASMGAPSCAGETYAFESVPTDVERGRHGSLYVSTLPGGPEDPSLGARGSVYRISRHGHVKRVATGFLGATNLAVAKGRIYVAELFAGKITKVYHGQKSTRLTIDSPVSVEATGKTLYVGTFPGPGGPGQIVSIPRVR